MYQVMMKCWTMDPEQRPSFASLMTDLTTLLNRFGEGEEVKTMQQVAATGYSPVYTTVYSTITMYSKMPGNP